MGFRMEGCPTHDTSPFLNGVTGYPSCQVTGLIQVCCRIPYPGADAVARRSAARSRLSAIFSGARRLCVMMATQIAGAGSVAGFATAVPMLMRAVLSCSVSWRCHAFTGAGFPDYLLVCLRRHFGQFADEGDNAPQRDVVVSAAPGGHAGHLDAMLDDPESTRGIDTRSGEVGRFRIKSLSYLGAVHAWRQMTPRAHCLILIGSPKDQAGVF